MSQMLKVLLKKFVITTLAPSMRSPSGITGWFARRLMRTANPESTNYAIQNRMTFKSSDVFVELGAGEGAGILAIMNNDDDNSNTIPSMIHLVEISDAMRFELERVVREDLPKTDQEIKIDIHGEDCKSMPYLQDGTVDTMFGMNVVYFLDPLPDYMKEIHRVLKPGTGEIVWGCKFDKVPKDNDVFVNVREDVVVQAMKDAGFEVTSQSIDVGASLAQECPKTEDETKDKALMTDMRNYIEIRGRRIE